MRIPLFGFCLSQPHEFGKYEALFHKAMKDQPKSAGKVSKSDCFMAIGDGHLSTTDPVTSEQFTFAGTLPGSPQDQELEVLHLFAQRLSLGPYASRDIPHGSFVFAHRPDANTLCLAADGFGTIPLFIVPFAGGCWFSSDQTLLFKIEHPFTIRPLSLVEGTHRFVPPPPLSYFSQMLSVPSSQVAHVNLSLGSAKLGRYHAIEKQISSTTYSGWVRRSDADVEDALEACLDAAVEASVARFDNVGLLLSGGVDSSLLAWSANKFTNLKSVHIDQPDGESELEYAQSVANHIGISLTTIEFSRNAFREHYVRAIYEQGQPFFIVNGMGLQYAARSGVFDDTDILIDGEGADFPMLSSTIRRSSLWRYHLSKNMRMPLGMVDKSIRKLSSLLQKLGYDTSNGGRPSGLHALLGARLIEDDRIYARAHDLLSHLTDPIERDITTQVIQGFDLSLQNLLTRLDTASRIAGKHTVFPYLHPTYTDFAINLPTAFKLRKRPGLSPKLEAKWAAKKVAAKHLPYDAIFRPKVGFGMPAEVWLGAFPEGFKKTSWIKEFFELSDTGFDHLLTLVGQSSDLNFIVSLEIWGRLFARSQSVEVVEGLFKE